MGKRVLIVDPYMKGLVGHSTGAARRFAKGLMDEGATVRVLGPKDAPVDAWDLDCELAAAWPASPSLNEVLWSKIPVANKAYNVIANTLYSSRVRARLAAEADTFAPDVVVMLTSAHSDIYALAGARDRTPVIACVHTILPNQRLSRMALERFGARAAAGEPFAIGVFTDEMADSYIAQGLPAHATVRLFYPHASALGGAVSTPPERFTITYAGDARRHKGFVFVADAATRLAREAHLVIQACPPVTGFYEPEVETAVEHLRELNDPEIELVFDVLPEAEFADFIAASSAILVTYDPTVYTGGRLSGIMNDALPAGIPLIISDGWQFAEEIKANGAGVVFTYGDADSLVDAVRTMRDDYGHYREAARAVSARLAARDPSVESARRILAFEGER